MKDVFKLIGFAMLIILALFLLAGCGGGTSREELLKLAGAATSAPAASVTPAPSPIPQPPATSQPVVIEVTREIAQPVEVTRIVIVTATPDIAGFQLAGVDESAQPCPARYWKRGRCMATQAQIEQASEVQP